MSGDDIILAKGGPDDLDAVMAVMEDSFDPRFGESWTRVQCAGLMPLAGVWLTLARLDGEVVGFALARAVADEAELLLLAVKAQHQRHGIGKRLLDHFAEAAAERGADRVHLEVRDGNLAIGLYMSAGFTLVGRRRNYYSGSDGLAYDALTLAKSIR
jgi:[ribosomal protein S18]-alanine N-acetyltransferase